MPKFFSRGSDDNPELPAMSFLEHLEELRRRILYSFVSVIVAFLACWWYSSYFVDLMQRPIVAALHAHGLPEKLVVLSPTDAFNTYIHVGLVAGVFLASPFVLYQLWLYISPALYSSERKLVLPFMFSTVGLFVAGGAFAYYIVFPASMNFLIDTGSQFTQMITVEKYSELFMAIIIGLGIIFEMPILVFFLALFGIVNAGWMWRNLRYSILIIFAIAGIVTPTTDIMNMCLFAAPMVVLYVVSIAVAYLVHPKQRKKRAEKAAGK